MSKKIKFNLRCNNNYVRTLDDLRNNFDPEDILNYFKGGLLQKWLKIREDENPENATVLEKINSIDETQDEMHIFEEMIKIFQIENDKDALESYYSITDYYDWKKGKTQKGRTIDDYYNGYNKIIQAIIDEGDKEGQESVERTKGYIAMLESKYLKIFKYNYLEVFFDFMKSVPKATVILLMIPSLRRLYFGENDEAWMNYLAKRSHKDSVQRRSTNFYSSVALSYNVASNQNEEYRVLSVFDLIYEFIYSLEQGDKLNSMVGTVMTGSVECGDQWIPLDANTESVMIMKIGAGVTIRSTDTGEVYDCKNTKNRLLVVSDVECKNAGSKVQSFSYLEI